MPDLCLPRFAWLDSSIGGFKTGDMRHAAHQPTSMFVCVACKRQHCDHKHKANSLWDSFAQVCQLRCMFFMSMHVVGGRSNPPHSWVRFLNVAT
jgi:hypothetical protein